MTYDEFICTPVNNICVWPLANSYFHQKISKHQMLGQIKSMGAGHQVTISVPLLSCHGNSCTSHCNSCCRHLLCVEAKNVSQKHHFHFFFFFYGCHYRHHKNFLLLFLLPSWFFKSGIETDRVELQWKKKRWKGLGRVNWREQSKGDGGVTCWQRSSQNCQSSSQYQ